MMLVNDDRHDKYDFEKVNLFQKIMVAVDGNDSNCNYGIPSVTQQRWWQ